MLWTYLKRLFGPLYDFFEKERPVERILKHRFDQFGQIVLRLSKRAGFDVVEQIRLKDVNFGCGWLYPFSRA